MGRKVFYSWQSDRPNATNRGLILSALKAACAELGEDPTIDERPEVDHDTQGVPGAPDIVQTIFTKVDGAHVFVADVSIITTDAESRACPNPNVLIELGYAIKTLGWNRILLVMNTAFGKPELLPFDLKTKRVTPYCALPDDKERAPERKRLQGIFQDALKSIFEHSKASAAVGEIIVPASLGDIARKAVEEGKPNAPSTVRRFMEWFGEQLEVLAPDRSAPVWDEVFVDALPGTIPLLVDFARLVEVIASHNAEEAASALFKGFECVLARYDVREGFVGSFRQTDFDLARFVGVEAFLMSVAALIREQRWSLLGKLLAEDLFVKSGRGTGTNTWSFHRIVDQVKTLEERNARLKLNRKSLQADLLKQRHEEGELSKLAPFSEFREADFFLLLRSEVQILSGSHGYWHPPTDVYFEDAGAPRYLLEAQSRTNAARLAPAFGLDSADALREAVVAAKPELLKALQSHLRFFFGGPLERFDPNTIATK
jgi:hypothetical protein